MPDSAVFTAKVASSSMSMLPAGCPFSHDMAMVMQGAWLDRAHLRDSSHSLPGSMRCEWMSWRPTSCQCHSRQSQEILRVAIAHSTTQWWNINVGQLQIISLHWGEFGGNWAPWHMIWYDMVGIFGIHWTQYESTLHHDYILLILLHFVPFWYVVAKLQ